MLYDRDFYYRAVKQTGAKVNEKRALSYLGFFRRFLTLTEDNHAGKPFLLSPFQKQIIYDVFGTVDPVTKKRIFKTVFVFLPRKNGKTEFIAGLCSGFFFQAGRGSQIYCIASDASQAGILYGKSAAMIEMSPALADSCTIVRSTKRIVDTGLNKVFRVMSGDKMGKHGYSPELFVYDELHEARDDEIWNTLATAQGARSEPLQIAITTAGHDTGSFCHEMYRYAKRVLSGEIEDPTFYPVIFEADPSDPWDDEDTWKKCNPNYGISVNPDFLKQECRKAKNMPSYENVFKRLYLNVWTESAVKWLKDGVWESCAARSEDILPPGSLIYGGLDLSSYIDLSAFCLVGQRPDKKIGVIPYIFCCESQIDTRHQHGKFPFRNWAADGHLLVTPGNVIDRDFIRQKVNEIRKKYHFKDYGYDRMLSREIVRDLRMHGIQGVEVAQGPWTMNAPIKKLEELIYSKNLVHPDNPVLNWMISGVMIQVDNYGNYTFSKKKSSDKIDGVVAMAIGLRRIMDQPRSIYAQRSEETQKKPQKSKK